MGWKGNNMALTDNGNGMYMPVAPAYSGGFGNGFGGDGWWIILLLLCGWGGMGFGGFGGWGGMMGLGYDFPWLLNGQNGINNNVSGGFRDQMLQNSITSVGDKVASGFGDVQLGIAGLNNAICQTGNGISQQLYNNEIASLNRSFSEQTANTQGFNGLQGQLAQCCCDNRLATVQTQNVVQVEAAASRAAASDNTQKILDKLCQLELDGAKREAADLRQQLTDARLAASQTAQNAFISQGFANEVDALYNRLNSCPVPTTPVYGRTPIFTCGGNNTGCGCGGNAFFN